MSNIQCLVSVIVPIYNVSMYLHQCISSICDQTYKNLEIILVNDGSTDESPVLCETFAKKDTRIRLIHQANAGLVRARQAGLYSATGKYVLNVDGDDWLQLDCVEHLVSAAEIHQSDVVISGYYREFVGNEVEIQPNIESGVYTKQDIRDKIFPRLIYDDKLCSHGISTFSWGKLFKKEFLFDHQMSVPKDISLGEDTVVTYPVIVSSDSLFVVDLPLYFYRQRAKSMLKSTESSESEIAKVNRMCSFLSSKVDGYGFDFTPQIEVYKFMLLAIRTGGLFGEDAIPKKLFPTSLDFKHQKIALYSSGAFGQQMWQKFREVGLNFCTWVDQDYYESNVWGADVMSIMDLSKQRPDIVVVATFDKKAFAQIKQEIVRVYSESEIIQPMLTGQFLTQ